MKTISLLMIAAIAAAALSAAQFLTPAAYAVTQDASGGNGGFGGSGGFAASLFGDANARGGDANGGDGGSNFNLCVITFAC
jgi:hypothetical protein